MVGIFFLILLTNLLILYSDDVNGEKRKAKFFAVLYVAVPTFDTIGLKGKFSVVSFFLCV